MLLILLLCHTKSVLGGLGEVKLTNGIYKNIIIKIEKDVIFDQIFFNSLKKLFQQVFLFFYENNIQNIFLSFQ